MLFRSPNLKGAERAIESGADLMLLPLSASHAHSLANLRKTPAEVIADFGRIRAAPDAAGASTLLEGEHHRIDVLSAQLEAAGLPYAAIVRPDQLMTDPHLLASGGQVPMQTDDGGTTDVVLLPLLMGGRRPGVRMPLPGVGHRCASVNMFYVTA